MIFAIPLLLFLVAAVTSGQFASQATLFSESKATGSSLEVTQPYPDLNAQRFNDLAQSVNFTGIFIFYGGPNYNAEMDAEVEWGYGPSPGIVLDFNQVSKKLSSLRFAGLFYDYTHPTLTLYEYNNFQGREEFLNFGASTLNLSGLVGSILITGSGNWTLYSERDFKGDSICLTNPPRKIGDYTPIFIHDLQALNIGTGLVRSIQKHCCSDCPGMDIIPLSPSSYGFRKVVVA